MMEENKHKFKHSVSIQIRFSDIDPLNHVNNSIIAQYYDIGRVGYLQKVLGYDLEWSDVNVVIVNLNTNFFAPITIGDDIFVETKLIGFGNKSMRTFQQIIDKNSNVVKSTCETIMSGFDKTTNQSSTIPDEIKKAFLDFEK